MAVLAACAAPSGETTDSGEGGDAGSGLPDTVKVMSIRELTGPLTYAGEGAQRGIDLAISHIEADGLLGQTSIDVDVRDNGGAPEESAAAASEAISDQSYVALFGPGLSNNAVAVAPIVQQAGLPTVFVQSGSDGVLLGDTTYRLTAPAETYFDLVGAYLVEQGASTATVVYNSGVPTLVGIGTEVVPALGDELGIEVVDSTGVEIAAQDFSAVASQVADANPDVVFVLLTGPQNPVAITQLRQAGFEGQIVGMLSMGAGNLDSVGEQATDVVWPTDFTPTQSGASTEAFVIAFEAEYGEAPDNFAAEGYDAMWFLARALAEADSVDRAALREAMATVAAEGFDGAQGELSFDGNDLRVPGVLVRWDGEREVAVGAGG